jgi:hypothetical protein
VCFNGATPPDTPYLTDIYTIQYDGIADAPQYPLNPVSDLNAFLGYFYLHPDYPTVPVSDYTVTLPTSPDYYTDGGVTHYCEMLTQNLPLLDPLRQIPVVGNPLADLVQLDFRVIVDLGYGDGYANVPTSAGLFPLVNPLTVGSELLTGAQQGVVAALVDVGLLPSTDLPTTYPYLPLAEIPGEIYSYRASHRRCPTRRARRALCCRRPPRCRRTSSICSVVAAGVRCLATSSGWVANWR